MFDGLKDKLSGFTSSVEDDVDDEAVEAEADAEATEPDSEASADSESVTAVARVTRSSRWPSSWRATTVSSDAERSSACSPRSVASMAAPSVDSPSAAVTRFAAESVSSSSSSSSALAITRIAVSRASSTSSLLFMRAARRSPFVDSASSTAARPSPSLPAPFFRARLVAAAGTDSVGSAIVSRPPRLRGRQRRSTRPGHRRG